jgi:alpha-glucosidase (family GH31 glycosyl hydrolase)
MTTPPVRATISSLSLAAWLGLGLACMPTTSLDAAPAHAVKASRTADLANHGITIALGSDAMDVRFIAPGIVHVRFKQDGAPALVIDPARKPTPFSDVHDEPSTNGASLTTTAGTVHWDSQHRKLQIMDAQRHTLLRIDVDTLSQGKLQARHAADDALYGIGGYNATENVAAGMLRKGKQVAEAGEQGHAGAPFVWSTAGYGILLDSDGATFALQPATITANSPHDTDVYILLGAPAQIFGSLAKLSGGTPMFPKWAMGFTNSQWGINQKELLQIVDTYRAKHIPIDNITLDFDWKAWGEDNYGEFRWNPVKFPDGPGGALKKQMDARGIHLTGIMKPRVHVDTVEGRYATAHGFWVPGEKVSDDYFSHKPVKDINFDLPAARRWFGDLAIKYGYDNGIVGWWNDEADTTGSDTEFMNMQRALYDSQRDVSNQRVWSINRNFWLGSQRYAYGLWSGDIATGFASMAGQRARMLSAINVGAMQWGMDGGGFNSGTPTPENYARWIQFGAFTPIFRVHGDFGQKRQPWVYGLIAEKAATDAIRLRYTLIPYIYAYAHRLQADGVGLVRPLLFDWPHDPQVQNDVDAWLFGDWLLAAPVVEPGQTEKDVYLPAGRWIDWFNGKVYAGGQTIHLAIDSTHWSDIPLFIRDGAIIPTQPVEDHVGQRLLTQLDVDVFPANTRTQFDYYDDDGNTYDYEKGAYFLQSLSVQRQGKNVRFVTGTVSGHYKPALKFYLLKIHGGTTTAVNRNAVALKTFDSLDALTHSQGEGWASGHDRYGAVTYVRVTAATAHDIALTLGDNG